jgi:hypothetical protein
MRLVFSDSFLPLALIGLAAVLPAQPVSTSAHQRSLLAESFARERLSVWQKRLNLQDWDVALEVVRSTELRPNTLGNIRWDAEKKTALIRILDPADYRLPYGEMLDDMEFTVVHELIHLRWRRCSCISPVPTPTAAKKNTPSGLIFFRMSAGLIQRSTTSNEGSQEGARGDIGRGAGFAKPGDSGLAAQLS